MPAGIYQMNVVALYLSATIQIGVISSSPYCFLKANFPPKKAIGIYPKPKSATVNQTGEGSNRTFAIPPARKKIPITNANLIL